MSITLFVRSFMNLSAHETQDFIHPAYLLSMQEIRQDDGTVFRTETVEFRVDDQALPGGAVIEQILDDNLNVLYQQKGTGIDASALLIATHARVQKEWEEMTEDHGTFQGRATVTGYHPDINWERVQAAMQLETRSLEDVKKAVGVALGTEMFDASRWPAPRIVIEAVGMGRWTVFVSGPTVEAVRAALK